MVLFECRKGLLSSVPDGFMFLGDESLTARTTTEGVTLVNRYSSIRDDASEASGAPGSGNPRGGKGFSQLPTLENSAPACRTVSEEEPAWSGSPATLSPAVHKDVKSNLHTDSEQQVCSRTWFVSCAACLHCSWYCILYCNP